MFYRCIPSSSLILSENIQQVTICNTIILYRTLFCQPEFQTTGQWKKGSIATAYINNCRARIAWRLDAICLRPSDVLGIASDRLRLIKGGFKKTRHLVFCCVVQNMQKTIQNLLTGYFLRLLRWVKENMLPCMRRVDSLDNQPQKKISGTSKIVRGSTWNMNLYMQICQRITLHPMILHALFSEKKKNCLSEICCFIVFPGFNHTSLPKWLPEKPPSFSLLST